jgi:hypothetical protein
MSARPVNVSDGERVAAGLLAAVLLAGAVRIRHPLRLIAAGCLIYRALRGHCFGYEWLGIGACKTRPPT